MEWEKLNKVQKMKVGPLTISMDFILGLALGAMVAWFVPGFGAFIVSLMTF